MLKALYKDQTAVVVGDVPSKTFQIKRGTKQGDPISPTIFNAVLEEAFREVQPRWRPKGWGIQLGSASGYRLCNLRFADDVLLLASTKSQLERMLEDLIAAMSRKGLSMHAGKTKILTNQTSGGGSLNASGNYIDILAPEESTMYLGRRFSLFSLHETELDNRIKQAWRKFWAHKSELCGKAYRLKDRLRLFNSVVTPSVLYSCGTWTMTTERMRRLRTAQRMMLRKIIGTKRKLITDANDSSSSSTSSGGSSAEDDTVLEP
jgi:hypothetical protein